MGAAVSGSAPRIRTSGLQRLDGARDAGDQAAAADAGDDRGRVRRVLENLEAHGRVTGDELVIVERVHERPFHARKRTRVQRLPGHVVRHGNERRAERPHPVDLRCRRGLDRDDGARHAGLSRRVGDALPGVSGADRPDATRALRLREHGHGVGGAAQLVGVDRLQVLELQPDVRIAGAELQPDERRADDGAGDALARVADLGQLDRADGFKSRRPREWRDYSGRAVSKCAKCRGSGRLVNCHAEADKTSREDSPSKRAAAVVAGQGPAVHRRCRRGGLRVCVLRVAGGPSRREPPRPCSSARSPSTRSAWRWRGRAGGIPASPHSTTARAWPGGCWWAPTWRCGSAARSGHSSSASATRPSRSGWTGWRSSSTSSRCPRTSRSPTGRSQGMWTPDSSPTSG